MKYAVIDVGSNSIRLMIAENSKTLYKKIETTKLGEGLNQTGKLNAKNVRNSILALEKFISESKSLGIDNVSIFGTEAVRSATNSQEFIQKIKELGQDLIVLNGNEEAELGYIGATYGKKGDFGIIDIGGGSTEITFGKDQNIIYAKSQPIGVRRILDNCGRDREKTQEYINSVISGFKKTSGFNMLAIGGTVTSLANVLSGQAEYNPEIVNGFVIEKPMLESIVNKLFEMSVDEIKKIKGMDVRRADVIAGGALLFLELMNYLSVEKVTISENDNLEGFLLKYILKNN